MLNITDTPTDKRVEEGQEGMIGCDKPGLHTDVAAISMQWQG